MTRACCRRGRRRASGAATSLLSGATLVLLPKCPLCLAAWLTVATGIGVSAAAATWLRVSAIVICASLLAVGAWRMVLPQRQNAGR